jgi:hypothetical protein
MGIILNYDSKTNTFYKDGYPKEEKVVESFDPAAFKKKIHSVRDETVARLKRFYPNEEIKVTINSLHRNLADQANLLKSGASEASISLHNFGAAADFVIKIGDVLYDGTGRKRFTDKKGNIIDGSYEPYQILGGVAKDNDLFWGWGWDSGHIAESRFVSDFISDYPEQADNEFVKLWYDINFDDTSLGVKPLMDVLDGLYGTADSLSVKRTYTGKARTIDTLLDPIYPSIEEDVFNNKGEIFE